MRRTPLERNQTLSDLLGVEVYLKLELFQKTGSFKPRGAFNQLLSADNNGALKRAVAVSGGNFAQAVAYAGKQLGIETVICMPEYTPKNYIEATRAYGATIDLSPDFPTTFARAEKYRANGYTFLHAWDNPHQVSGNATIGLEILEELPDVTDMVISIGGGGLISGIISAVKPLKPDVRFWGVETKGAATMKTALDAGKIVQITPTSLARTLGAPYVSEYAFEVASKNLSDLILVDDKEAIEDQRFLLERTKLLTELAASCTLSAAKKIAPIFSANAKVLLLICGGNESLDNLINYSKTV